MKSFIQFQSKKMTMMNLQLHAHQLPHIRHRNKVKRRPRHPVVLDDHAQDWNDEVLRPMMSNEPYFTIKNSDRAIVIQ